MCGAFFTLKGCGMYQKAMQDKPRETGVREIRSGEGFTTYEKLPQFYIGATISVEDHCFTRHWGITRQLAGNLLFSAEKRIERKVAERIYGEY